VAISKINIEEFIEDIIEDVIIYFLEKSNIKK
jgi:hypothetical protein